MGFLTEDLKKAIGSIGKVFQMVVRRSVSFVMVLAYVHMMAYPVLAGGKETFEEGKDRIRMRVRCLQTKSGNRSVKVSLEVTQRHKGTDEIRNTSSTKLEVLRVFETDKYRKEDVIYKSLGYGKGTAEEGELRAKYPWVKGIYVTEFGDVKVEGITLGGSWLEVKGVKILECDGVKLGGIKSHGVESIGIRGESDIGVIEGTGKGICIVEDGSRLKTTLVSLPRGKVSVMGCMEGKEGIVYASRIETSGGSFMNYEGLQIRGGAFWGEGQIRADYLGTDLRMGIKVGVSGEMDVGRWVVSGGGSVINESAGGLRIGQMGLNGYQGFLVNVGVIEVAQVMVGACEGIKNGGNMKADRYALQAEIYENWGFMSGRGILVMGTGVNFGVIEGVGLRVEARDGFENRQLMSVGHLGSARYVRNKGVIYGTGGESGSDVVLEGTEVETSGRVEGGYVGIGGENIDIKGVVSGDVVTVVGESLVSHAGQLVGRESVSMRSKRAVMLESASLIEGTKVKVEGKTRVVNEGKVEGKTVRVKSERMENRGEIGGESTSVFGTKAWFNQGLIRGNSLSVKGKGIHNKTKGVIQGINVHVSNRGHWEWILNDGRWEASELTLAGRKKIENLGHLRVSKQWIWDGVEVRNKGEGILDIEGSGKAVLFDNEGVIILGRGGAYEIESMKMGAGSHLEVGGGTHRKKKRKGVIKEPGGIGDRVDSVRYTKSGLGERSILWDGGQLVMGAYEDFGGTIKSRGDFGTSGMWSWEELKNLEVGGRFYVKSDECQDMGRVIETHGRGWKLGELVVEGGNFRNEEVINFGLDLVVGRFYNSGDMRGGKFKVRVSHDFTNKGLLAYGNVDVEAQKIENQGEVRSGGNLRMVASRGLKNQKTRLFWEVGQRKYIWIKKQQGSDEQQREGGLLIKSGWMEAETSLELLGRVVRNEGNMRGGSKVTCKTLDLI